MAEIIFFEKPGCINGDKQKAILRAAGHSLSCIDILKYPWSPEKLLIFVAGKEPSEMINSTAPAVKKGEVVHERLFFDEALNLMVANPILIKRPLIAVNGLSIQGFTDPRLAPFLGDWDGRENVTTCPKLQTLSCDEQKGGSR
ncbi:MAG: nitrogenase-associated protein [Proteobacteria bacterium]|nr:nitrogenase-associated protein [Pseudomonadota bacterium]MBU1639600.1 nitrogenase-associated protein [Pseudomonadota bacterium]